MLGLYRGNKGAVNATNVQFAVNKSLWINNICLAKGRIGKYGVEIACASGH